MRRILPPSPFRSVKTFIVYCLTLSTPVWNLLSFLGNVDLIATYANPIANVLTNPFGMWIPVAGGFALLIWINYKEKSEPDASSEYMSRYLLTLALKAARGEAHTFLSDGMHPISAEMWANRTYKLVQDSLGDDMAKKFDEAFCSGWHGQHSHIPVGSKAPKTNDALKRGIKVLDSLITIATSFTCPKLRDGFDPYEWLPKPESFDNPERRYPI